EGAERVDVDALQVDHAREPLALAVGEPAGGAVEELAEEEGRVGPLGAHLLDEQAEQEGEALGGGEHRLAPLLRNAGLREEIERGLAAEGGEADRIPEVLPAVLVPRRVHGVELVAAEDDDRGGELGLGEAGDEGADQELFER